MLPNSIKCHWRQLIVEKLTFNSQPIARSLKTTSLALCCVTQLHIFIVASYCPQHKVHLGNGEAKETHTCLGEVHLCNDHLLLDMPDLSGGWQRRNAHSNKFVH